MDAELTAITANLPRMDLADVAASREMHGKAIATLPVYEPAKPVNVTDVVIPGHQGDPQVPGRMYAPAERHGPIPGLIYLHPGGFTLGGLIDGESTGRLLADRLGIAVLSVDYRLAPEHPYPAALHDSYASLEWMAGAGASEFGIDVERIGVLGESAGGGLAAALALLTRDHSGPRLCAQFLDAPTVDDRLTSHSMRHLPDAPIWQASNSPHIWNYYLGPNTPRGGSDVPLYAAPNRAKVDDLTGLPPAYVMSYQVDCTRDEGFEYGHRLIQAGVPTELRNYAGAFHLTHIIPGTNIGARIIADRDDAIRRLLRVS